MDQLTDADLTNLRTLLSWVPDDKLNDQWQTERDDLYHRLGVMRNRLDFTSTRRCICGKMFKSQHGEVYCRTCATEAP